MWRGSMLIGLTYYAVPGRIIHHVLIMEQPIVMSEKVDA